MAGMPIGIITRYDSTRELFREYLTDELPMLIISVSEEEMLLEDDEISEHTEQMAINRKIASSLTEFDAFLLHAAVIRVDGQGIGFAAGSGIGKTTRALLWKKALGNRVKIVNGDKPIIRFMEDGVYTYGSPWKGKEMLGDNSSVPMKAMCFIERGEDVSLKRMTPDEAAIRLMRQVLIPREPYLVQNFISLLERFVQTVPFYLYTCNQEKEKPEELWKQICEDTAKN